MDGSFSLGSVVMKFVADLTGLKAGVEQAKQSTKTLKKEGASLGQAFTQVGSIMGVALGGAAVIGAIKNTVNAFEQSQRVLAQTQAVLASTGGVAGVTAEQVSKLSKEIQNTTAVSDESAQATQNMLLTFTQIGSDVFPDATRAAIDMATAMNGGVTPAETELIQQANLLGKALNDPITGMNKLQRQGVVLSQSQQDLIEKLAKAGKTAEAQRVLLDELSTEYGGSAATAAQTFAGRVQMLTNQFDDFKELIGGAVVPMLEYFLDAANGAAGAGQVLLFVVRALSSGFMTLAYVGRMAAQVINGVFSTLGAVATGQFSLIGDIWKQTGQDMAMDTVKFQQKIDDVWTSSADKQVTTTKKAYNKMADASAAKTAKVKKDLEDETKKFEAENKRRERDFKESLAELVRAHQDKKKELENDLADENRDFNERLEDRKVDFDERMADMKESHEDKVATIMEQIAEEQAKGELADQAKVDSLLAALEKENIAYEAEKLKAEQREQTELERMRREHDAKVLDLQTRLDTENALLLKHEGDVAAVKDQAVLDDIDRLKRQFAEENEKSAEEHQKRMVDIAERGDELGNTLGSNIDAGLGAQKGKINDTMNDIAGSAAQKLVDGIGKGATQAGENMVKNLVNGIINKAKSAWEWLTKNGLIGIPLFDDLKNLGDVLRGKNIQSFDTGGTVQGAFGSPQLIMAHAGETVLPTHKSSFNSMGNIYVDLTGAFVGDAATATRMGELVGDNIIKKLKMNVRF